MNLKKKLLKIYFRKYFSEYKFYILENIFRNIFLKKFFSEYKIYIMKKAF